MNHLRRLGHREEYSMGGVRCRVRRRKVVHEIPCEERRNQRQSVPANKLIGPESAK